MSDAVKTVSRIALLLFAGSLSPVLGQAPVQHTFDWQGLARGIVARLDLQPGDKVLLLTQPGRFEPLVPELRYAIVQAGGIDLGNLDALPQPFPAQWDLAPLQETLAPTREVLRRMFSEADAVLKLPGAESGVAYLAAQDVLREGRGRTVHFHWVGAYPLHGQPLPPQGVIDATYQRALLETDYAALGEAQRRFEAALRSGPVHVTTADGTDIRFSVGDRPVTRQDGDASARRADAARNLIDREIELPAGAVRVAPLEESVQGVVVIPLSTWNGRPVEDLRLRFAAGKLVEFDAGRGREAVAAELEAGGAAARSFREFALGFNPLLAIPETNAWIPYYGYGAGVVRLSLGDNTELGGAVSGGYVRWNFFPEASVRVGDQVWVRDGVLQHPR